MSRRKNLYCIPVSLIAIIAFLHLYRLNFNLHLFFHSEEEYDVRQPFYKFNGDVASYLPLGASEGIKPTTMLRHAPGFTIFDKLYMMNSTLYIVTDSPQDFPPFPSLVSTGYPWTDGFPAENAKRVPTPKHIQIVSAKDAPKQFVMQPVHVQGVTFLCNDAPQYIPHYFAFVGEILFGLWRTYASLDPSITAGGETSLPPARRLVFPYTPFTQWRDSAGFNQYVFRALFPGASLEFLDDWTDRIDSGRPYVFDRIVLQDRMASFTGPAQAETQRMAAESLTIPASDNWFAPFRNKIVDASLASTKFAARKKGHLDALIEFGKEIINGRMKRFGPTHVITYISRQSSSRRTLNETDHNQLVTALKELETKFGYEVYVVEMEKLSKEEQITLASKSTILMGVHGAGLTASLWMQPTPKSAVLEIFQPGSFKTEYQWTVQEGLKLPYYAIWGDKALSGSDIPQPHIGDEFESTQIPVNVDAIIELIQARLAPDVQPKRRYPPQIRRS